MTGGKIYCGMYIRVTSQECRGSRIITRICKIRDFVDSVKILSYGLERSSSIYQKYWETWVKSLNLKQFKIFKGTGGFLFNVVKQ